MPAVVHDSIPPKITKQKLDLCNSILKGVVSKSKMAVQMQACLQDAENPSVARSIGTVMKVAKIQQIAAKKALKAEVIKQELLVQKVMKTLNKQEKEDDDDDDDDDDHDDADKKSVTHIHHHIHH